MLRSDESETAEPQNESLREASCGQPRERTSVAVSERAQQKDYFVISILLWKRRGVEGVRKNMPDPAPSVLLQRSSSTQ